MVKYNLHPGAMWLFRRRIVGWVIATGILIGGFLTPFLLAVLKIIEIKGFLDILFYSAFPFLTVVIILSIGGEIWVRLYYDRWFYEFTDTNLKLEKGVIYKIYTNIPYERVQNIDIYRGIIARLCGFSAISIQTAGSWSTEGYIPAVSLDTSEKIREFLIKKIGKKKKTSSNGL